MRTNMMGCTTDIVDYVYFFIFISRRRTEQLRVRRKSVDRITTHWMYTRKVHVPIIHKHRDDIFNQPD